MAEQEDFFRVFALLNRRGGSGTHHSGEEMGNNP
jgi:hypothetical protein